MLPLAVPWNQELLRARGLAWTSSLPPMPPRAKPRCGDTQTSPPGSWLSTSGPSLQLSGLFPLTVPSSLFQDQHENWKCFFLSH